MNSPLEIVKVFRLTLNNLAKSDNWDSFYRVVKGFHSSITDDLVRHIWLELKLQIMLERAGIYYKAFINTF